MNAPRGDRIERWLLRVAGTAGFAIFAAFFALTFAVPQWVEDFAAAYLGFAFLFVCDIAMNRGRVTAHIANGSASVLGSAFTLTPC